jgi:hypothetical protein
MRTATPPTRLTVALLALVMLAAIVARALPGPRTIDDAFITFRYSRNLVEGLGFVYNPGVQTLGTTTPLFTLLMASISGVTGGRDYPTYAIAVSALADAASAALLLLIARRLTGRDWIGGLLGLLWAVSPRSVTFAVGGMETSVNILWMLGATWAYLQGWSLRLGLFAALGLLTRIDSALWVGPLLLAQLIETWRSRRTLPWRTWLMCAAVMLPWLIFSAFYFGSPLPNSLSAKTVAYVLPAGAALGTFITSYSTPFFEFDTFGAVGAMVAGVVYLALSLFGLLYTARRLPRLLPLLLYPWLYLLAFAIANPLIFRWYVAPPMPALMLGIVAGAWALLGGRALRRVAPWGMGGLGLLWLLMSLNGWTLTPDHGPNRPAPKMAWHEIELHYERVGTLLREQYDVTADTRVASADIGAVGYFSGATIIDTVGLVTPELRRYYPVAPALIVPGQNYAIPPALVLDAEPAFLVTMEAFVRLGLLEMPDFTDHYRLIEEIPTGYYGTGMQVYQRTNSE